MSFLEYISEYQQTIQWRHSILAIVHIATINPNRLVLDLMFGHNFFVFLESKWETSQLAKPNGSFQLQKQILKFERKADEMDGMKNREMQ